MNATITETNAANITVRKIGESRIGSWWVYSLHQDHVSRFYASEAAAKAAATRHVNRGGLSAEWFLRNTAKRG